MVKQKKALINPYGEVYTATDVAAILKVHHVTILRDIRKGQLNAVKFGRDYRITKDDLDTYIATKKAS